MVRMVVSVTLTVSGVAGSLSERKFHLIRALPPTGIAETTPTTPLQTELFQNYPNPFNPSSDIRFSIAQTDHVTLKVYDVLGREVAVLVNDVKKPGTYDVVVDASGLASGVYFYRLQVGAFAETRRMIAVK